MRVCGRKAHSKQDKKKKKKRDPIEERLYRFDDVKIKIFRYKHEKTYKQN